MFPQRQSVRAESVQLRVFRLAKRQLRGQLRGGSADRMRQWSAQTVSKHNFGVLKLLT
ncbi:hypothetical protein BN2476_970021 [Paraburkholderia piptadeniae]|uniref:Uncharacterized protein n=1 Tax=Paraburkholderia piptadeniae TaxID=1701573 RepID=A0A1N7SUL2_9BURK|nr:hypothetical protein BN2476_970021 [Paraburkholderia piptadeniae]